MLTSCERLALQSEIDSSASPASTAQNSIISDEEAKKLPYLEAVIKESVRICPPATGILSKKTPPQGDTINGIYVPGGIDIGQCAWGIQRSKAVYGEDSMLFRPERWLEAKGADLEKMEKSLNLAWGYGKYSCLGKSISWLEMNKVVFEVSSLFFLVCQRCWFG
jgi:cytochrome P450